MWHIKKSLLEDIIQSSKNYLPDEFLCFLGGNTQKQEIIEIIFLPNQSDESSTSINMNAFPSDATIIGSAHSHPNSSILPSNADKKFFKRFKINIIIGLNKFETRIGFYNEKTNKIEVKIID
jgi:proteasome lid subunit RPN8/RPN11